MPHEFIEREDDLEPLAGGSHSGGPPHKYTSAGVLDPPFPPKKPLGPIPALVRSPLFRIFVIVMLAGLALMALLTFFKIL
jgi:hypothetical protein